MPKEAGAYALLMAMPEPDFRLAVEAAARAAPATEKLAPRISEVCRARGAPWRFVADGGFQWVGDEVVERELVRPALAALNDPRFAGGVRSEFESARNELRAGTAVGRKQAVYECGCAVESAMKVVLDERAIAYDARDTAQKLFEHLVAAGLVPRYHPTGTCALGAVVGSNAAVHGLENLYVGDASLIPRPVRAGTPLTALAVAERVAELLRQPAGASR